MIREFDAEKRSQQTAPSTAQSVRTAAVRRADDSEVLAAFELRRSRRASNQK